MRFLLNFINICVSGEAGFTILLAVNTKITLHGLTPVVAFSLQFGFEFDNKGIIDKG